MGLLCSHGSGWTTTIQWLRACSNQAHVAVRESLVAGITQTSVNLACHRCSSSPPSSLAPDGSRIERTTRFPWETPTRSTSLSVRTPMDLFMSVFVRSHEFLSGSPLSLERGGMKVYRVFIHALPLAGERFCGAERSNCARKGLCNASLATRLLSAKLFEVCMPRALV